MSKSDRTHIVNDNIDDEGAPKNLTKDEFARRVYRAMIAKGWRQSELSRQSGLTRDSISQYVRGKSFPTPYSLGKLSEALGVEPTDLLPNHLAAAIAQDQPDFEMKVSPGDKTKAWVRLNRLMSFGAAAKIAEIVNADMAN